jgi:ABC-type sugar transport system ATPase subunit
MANIKLRNITKTFGKIKALDQVNLEIKDKEFFVLFGPAGAGKTTILKTIAGIEFPDDGHVIFNDDIVNLVEPAKRNVSMVFENYALYPHLNVFDNIASPMRSPLYKKDEAYINKQIVKVTSTMKIDHLLERLPSQLSNGQRQRVALGRSLVRNPNVFLMDEPLAHLDAKLRHHMRTELKAMQTQLDTTTIYVTHDYMEALSLGDRIAIINEGKIEQIGTGDEVYYTPKNLFVAKLVGEPEINTFKGELAEVNQKVKMKVLNQMHLFDLELDVEQELKNHHSQHVIVGIRGINVSYSFVKKEETQLEGSVYSFEPIGNKTILIVKIGDELIRTIAPNDLQVDIDQKIFIEFDFKNAMFFDMDTEELLVRHNQEEIIKEVL